MFKQPSVKSLELNEIGTRTAATEGTLLYKYFLKIKKEIKNIKSGILCGGNSGGKEIIAIKFTPEVFTFQGNCGDLP